MDGFKKIIGFVVAFAIAAGVFHGFSSGEKLKPFEEFRSHEGRFTVLMPGEPKREMRTEHTDTGPINIVIHIAGTKNDSFIVFFADYPANLVQGANVKDMFDGATQKAVTRSGGRLLEQYDSDYHGKPGREVRIELTKGGKTATIRTWFILVGNRMYQLMAASPSEDIINEEGQEFYDSFIIDGVR